MISAEDVPAAAASLSPATAALLHWRLRCRLARSRSRASSERPERAGSFKDGEAGALRDGGWKLLVQLELVPRQSLGCRGLQPRSGSVQRVHRDQGASEMRPSPHEVPLLTWGSFCRGLASLSVRTVLWARHRRAELLPRLPAGAGRPLQPLSSDGAVGVVLMMPSTHHENVKACSSGYIFVHQLKSPVSELHRNTRGIFWFFSLRELQLTSFSVDN